MYPESGLFPLFLELKLVKQFGKLIQGLGGVRALGVKGHLGTAVEISAEHIQNARSGVDFAPFVEVNYGFKGASGADKFRGRSGM
jgi:hypothetical protein